MSSVSNDLPANRRSIDELEQDYELQKKRLKEKSEAREAKLETNFKTSKRDMEEKSERAVGTVRDEFVKSAAASREADKTARESLLKTQYDRQGRLQEQIDLQAKQREADGKTFEGAQKANSEQIARIEKNHEEKFSRQNAINQKSMNDAVENARRMTDKAAGESRPLLEAEYNDLKATSERAIARARDDSRTAEVGTRNSVEEVESHAKRLNEKYAEEADARAARVQEVYETKLRDAAEFSRRSRETENGSLRKQIKDFTTQDKEFGKDLNQARAATIRDTEGMFNGRIQMQEDAHVAESRHQKMLEKQMEKNLSNNFEDALRTRDVTQAERVKRMNSEHFQTLKQTENEFGRALNETKVLNEREKEAMNRTFAAQRAANNEKAEKALIKQSDTGRDDTYRMAEASQYRINQLEGEVRDLKTTADPTKVSAAVEAKIRAASDQDNQKRLDAETKRNQESLAHQRSEFIDRFSEVHSDKTRAVAQVRREALQNQTAVTSQLNDQLEDTQHTKELAIREANERNNRRETQSLKNSERALMAQAQHFQETGADRDLDTSLRMKQQKEDSDFQFRQLKRDYAAKMNVAQKDFDRKLTVQREDYEMQIADLRKTLSTYQRDSDKRTGQLLAEQERSYNKRLAEVESQSTQREK